MKVWTPVPDGMYIGKTTRDSDFEVDGAWLRTYYRGAKGWGCKIPTERGWQLCHLVEQPLSLSLRDRLDRLDMPDAPAMLTPERVAAIESMVEFFHFLQSGELVYDYSADAGKYYAANEVLRAWLAALGAEA